jgi:hypothetical protein
MTQYLEKEFSRETTHPGMIAGGSRRGSSRYFARHYDSNCSARLLG